MMEFERPTIYDSHESGPQDNNADTKPWDREPTPLVNSMESANKLVGQDSSVDGDDARNLERRMRAAERLLGYVREWFVEVQRLTGVSSSSCEWSSRVQSHLEAAKKEDGQ